MVSLSSHLSPLDLAINPTVPTADTMSYLDLVDVPPIEVSPSVIAVHNHAVGGPLEAVKAAYRRLENAYHKTFSLTFRRRVTQVQSGFSKGGKLLFSAYKAVDPLLDIFRNTVLTGDLTFLKNTGFLKFAKITRLFSVFSLPISLVEMAKGGYECVLSCRKKDFAEVAEQGLSIANCLGDLSYGISTFIDGLIASSVVESTAALTAASTYLTGIGAILSIAAIALQTKFIYESVKLKNRITKAFGSEEKPDFQAVVKEIDKISNARLARTIGVSDGEKLRARLHAIYERNSNPTENPEHKNNIISTVSALKNRIKWNTIGRYLKITAAVISLVALAVLMFSPAAPVGYGLLAASAAIGLAVLVMDYKAEQNLNDHLKTLAPNDSLEMWKFYGKKQRAKDLKNNSNLRLWDLSNIGKDAQRKKAKREQLPLPNTRPQFLNREEREAARLECLRLDERLRNAQAAREERLRNENARY